MPELLVTETIRVAVADDQQLFASGLAMLLEAQSDLACVGVAADGAEALALAAAERPDVVLMDLRMPVMNGLDATRALLGGRDAADAAGRPRVVVLTTIGRDEAVYSALAAGASAFLTKDASPERVVETIRAVHSGRPVPSEGEALALVREFATAGGVSAGGAATTDPLEGLSARERETFALVARGLSNAEIASERFVAEATVKTQIRSMLQKLGMRSRIHLVIYAYENGLAG